MRYDQQMNSSNMPRGCSDRFAISSHILTPFLIVRDRITASQSFRFVRVLSAKCAPVTATISGEKCRYDRQ